MCKPWDEEECDYEDYYGYSRDYSEDYADELSFMEAIDYACMHD